MEIGFKDISILDSEEQFLGRINRSCEHKGYAYFFNLSSPRIVYRNDHRINMNLLSLEYQKDLETKDFDKFYNECFNKIEEKKSQLNENNIENMIDELRFLRFDCIYERMKLILEKNYQIYLPYIIKNGEDVIDGRKVWEEYIALIHNKEVKYAEKKIKLSQLYEKMNLFMYNLRKEPKIGINQLGNIYYIDNGQEYIIDGKFDRVKFENVQEGLFL